MYSIKNWLDVIKRNRFELKEEPFHKKKEIENHTPNEIGQLLSEQTMVIKELDIRRQTCDLRLLWNNLPIHLPDYYTWFDSLYNLYERIKHLPGALKIKDTLKPMTYSSFWEMTPDKLNEEIIKAELMIYIDHLDITFQSVMSIHDTTNNIANANEFKDVLERLHEWSIDFNILLPKFKYEWSPHDNVESAIANYHINLILNDSYIKYQEGTNTFTTAIEFKWQKVQNLTTVLNQTNLQHTMIFLSILVKIGII